MTSWQRNSCQTKPHLGVCHPSHRWCLRVTANHEPTGLLRHQCRQTTQAPSQSHPDTLDVSRGMKRTQPLLDDVPDSIRLGPLPKTSAKGRAVRKSAKVDKSEHVSAFKFVLTCPEEAQSKSRRGFFHDRLHERAPR